MEVAYRCSWWICFGFSPGIRYLKFIFYDVRSGSSSMLVPVFSNPFVKHVALNGNPKLIKGKKNADGNNTKNNESSNNQESGDAFECLRCPKNKKNEQADSNNSTKELFYSETLLFKMLQTCLGRSRLIWWRWKRNWTRRTEHKCRDKLSSLLGNHAICWRCHSCIHT